MQFCITKKFGVKKIHQFCVKIICVKKICVKKFRVIKFGVKNPPILC